MLLLDTSAALEPVRGRLRGKRRHFHHELCEEVENISLIPRDKGVLRFTQLHLSARTRDCALQQVFHRRSGSTLNLHRALVTASQLQRGHLDMAHAGALGDCSLWRVGLLTLEQPCLDEENTSISCHLEYCLTPLLETWMVASKHTHQVRRGHQAVWCS